MTKKMNKSEDLVKKYKLEEAVKKFQKINEYTFYSPTMVEDDQNQNDGDMQPMDNPQGDNPNSMGGGIPQGEQGGEIPQQGGISQDEVGGGMEQEPPMDDVGEVSTDGQEGVTQNSMDDSEMPPIGNEDDDIEDVEMDTEQPG